MARTSRSSKPQPSSPRAKSAKGDLTRYREMRDFGKTPEPSGEREVGHPDTLRFVIQKHAARRLHYDLRLELNGVFKSWAVTRGPSLDPHEKRLAVHVEDHPIEYGSFEGVIPKGEYGGGTVMIWDRGFWIPEGDPVKGYEKGHLAFDLEGEKLKGRWHLIRLKARPREKKEQWLLFKSDDQYAEPSARGDVLEEAPNSVASDRTMDEIADEQAAVWSSQGGLVKGALSLPSAEPSSEIPSKGGKGRGRRPAGKAASDGEREAPEPATKIAADPSAIGGAKKAGFPGFVEPCLALLAEAPPEGADWLHEIKFDGYRLIALVDGESPKLLTRRGLDWTHRFSGIAKSFERFPAQAAIVDGEAVVEDANGVSSFSALQEALSDGSAGANAVFFAFDLLYLDGWDLRGARLEDRKGVLAQLLAPNKDPALRYSDHILSNGGAMYEHACRLGLEGIVSKKCSASYRSGRQSDWLKIKCTNREEFVIGGYVPSTATRNAIGSLALGYYDDGELIHVGRTGTGFTQRSAQALYKQLQGLREQKSPFASKLTADEKRGLIFVRPELVAQIEFGGWTHDRHLRHAAFKGLREDKPAAEVQLEVAGPMDNGSVREPAMQRKEKKGAVKRARNGNTEFEGVRLTHPDRILWQGQGLTKLGLAEYYAGIADWILPHVTSRPLALVRCPSGSEGECFFQKHAFAGLTDAIEVVAVPEKQGSDETLVIRDLRGLISLVQASALEIHPWGADIEDVERPDRLTFDLDPGEGIDWETLAEAAREVRQRLLDVGVESFVKTTGGKGLHVVSPLKPELDWDELKEFTRRIALSMEADNPRRYVSTMAKKARAGKIFVDYLRNGRGATAIAAYSTRARPNAPVSTPLRWDELGPGMTPDRFNVSNLPRRLSALRSDPWEGFFSSPQIINRSSL